MRHIVVTGAAGAIGGALARRLRQRWPHATLVLTDRAHVRDAAVLGAVSSPVDLADLDALPAWLDGLVDRHGPIDGLVNNAGLMDVQAATAWSWDRTKRLIDVDLMAPMRLMQAVLPGMSARRRGFVVNVASMAGRTPIKGCSVYGAAKAGLAMASEISRGELAGRGVHVLTVYPGPVASALEAGARAQLGGGGVIGRLLPVGRPDGLADAILIALDRRSPRVVYPSVYHLGWTRIAEWFTLAAGPQPEGALRT